MARRTVAVIGGGGSGVLVAREVLRCTGDRVVLVEPGEPGGGVAYGAAKPWHVLNSRAGAMSADPDDPAHFARWAGAGADAFLPRPLYGRYLRAVLHEAVAAHPGRFQHCRARATAVAAGRVHLDTGAVVRADQVVLATGSPAGAQPAAVPPALRSHPGYVPDPWLPGALEAIPGDVPVLLIGAGLTAIDVALTLTAGDPGAAGGARTAPVVAVSRRGLLPLGHTASAARPLKPALDGCARLRDVIRVVRAAAGAAADWRAVVDGLRPDLDRLWAALTPAEQDAFLRHLARPWECHRHRMAPEVATKITALRAGGAFVVRAGGLRGLVAGAGGGLIAELADGPRRFGAVVNCSGPGRLPAAADPLVRTLLDAGLARTGPHGLGLDIDDAGRLRDRAGAAGGIWLIGPLRRGAQWETTAMPEIRTQARRLATTPAGEASRFGNTPDDMASAFPQLTGALTGI
jgi:uncharacterized NAD(P)/FAD-binding protein YdhS